MLEIIKWNRILNVGLSGSRLHILSTADAYSHRTSTFPTNQTNQEHDKIRIYPLLNQWEGSQLGGSLESENIHMALHLQARIT